MNRCPKQDIVFLGNSITAGTNWAKLLDMPNAKNRGISGDISIEIHDAMIVQNYKGMVQRIKAGYQEWAKVLSAGNYLK
ncbi:hypothetical protein AQ505_23800 [Pedobacter sp. PACM 27299]|uniref:hypothetical protein n=1 Tax=Pedobacter sp. PACM 27299 TaxID=1727164 RepID=UPI0007056CCC|nr:hypothetical protein [Pedobacter sp. PACM 27299]ALL08237.1 hypothetical protein AQ505_23800 [Pedobacter sp. PACM 27299]